MFCLFYKLSFPILKSGCINCHHKISLNHCFELTPEFFKSQSFALISQFVLPFPYWLVSCNTKSKLAEGKRASACFCLFFYFDHPPWCKHLGPNWWYGGASLQLLTTCVYLFSFLWTNKQLGFTFLASSPHRGGTYIVLVQLQGDTSKAN